MQHRVVSLLPAASEAVCALGGLHLLVGRSHCDDNPPELMKLPPVTSARIKGETSKEIDDQVNSLVAKGEDLYLLDMPLLQQLKPTVIITQGLCTVCAISDDTVRAAAKHLDPPPTVVSLSPMSLEDIIRDIEYVGEAIGLSHISSPLSSSLRARVQSACERGAALVTSRGGVRPRVLFMEWSDPIFTGGHWTPQIIQMAGGEHTLNPPDQPSGAARPSFRVAPEAVVAMDPDIIIVCPCGYDLEKTISDLAPVSLSPWWLGLRAVHAGQVVLVDGNQMFNRSGPRVVDALEWLVALFQGRPEDGPEEFPWQWWKKGEEQANGQL